MKNKQLTLPIPELSLDRLIEKAIGTLQTFCKDNNRVAFSGGKDSIVIYKLAELSGIQFEAVYNVTTIDYPELIRFIKKYYPQVIWERAKETFLQALSRKGLPSRVRRWCCEIFKESKSPIGTILIMGCRAAESNARARRWKTITKHTKTKEIIINPILYWKLSDVWEFIDKFNLPYCKLYDEGHKRLGCIGCPMSRNRGIEIKLNPGFERLWRLGCKRFFDKRILFWEHKYRKKEIKYKDIPKTYRTFSDSDDLFDWWLTDECLPKEDECTGMLDLWSL